MSKKRGLSLEEKREKMLQIFYESQDFFLLKELEKLGPRKGVITQSVKDVVQSLVDDDLVSKDKIGTSVYFWSLPSCAGNQLRNVYHKLESDLQSSKKRLVELVDQCNSLKKGREESRKQLKWPMQQLTDGQITSSHCGNGVQTTFPRPKNSLKTCTRRLEYLMISTIWSYQQFH
ncbi:meiotic nuclear division protein 1 homolog isoform X3 [Carya illinoinensis]|uniref:meiotic nuclear division protein 1 homolog isoform X3 n=1 Tax=Carya illinoinensis TaxID=32201 RepID=UPI001C719799|nr:meiotic nuclear division protein 1 homolog isoform X3 [Carya illinoinensis]